MRMRGTDQRWWGQPLQVVLRGKAGSKVSSGEHGGRALLSGDLVELADAVEPLPRNISSHHADGGLRLTKAAPLLPRAAAGRQAWHNTCTCARRSTGWRRRQGRASSAAASSSWRRTRHRVRAGGAATTVGEVELEAQLLPTARSSVDSAGSVDLEAAQILLLQLPLPSPTSVHQPRHAPAGARHPASHLEFHLPPRGGASVEGYLPSRATRGGREAGVRRRRRTRARERHRDRPDPSAASTRGDHLPVPALDVHAGVAAGELASAAAEAEAA
jgi:hypothetical protein